MVECAVDPFLWENVNGVSYCRAWGGEKTQTHNFVSSSFNCDIIVCLVSDFFQVPAKPYSQ